MLSHRMMDGSERPIAHASKTLTKTERQYTQEALGLYWGTPNFHAQVIWKDDPTLITDHKPLQYVMAPDKAIPSTAAARYRDGVCF